ncbi:MAG: tyrosine--tRNA ligase [Patescibacteria group bacterium]|nr:tyrosine--tRNA ligase [Patescibacteria group bacterium]
MLKKKELFVKKEEIIKDILTRGVTNVIEKKHLEEALKSGKKLRIKLGIDPTGPKIHIGRAFTLWKLRQFQELGHKVVLIIGDFTGQIGDASDKEAERQALSLSDIKRNMKTYEDQIGKILDMKKVEIRYNSEWLGKLSAQDLVEEAMNFTVAQMIERDNYWERFKNGKPIGLHEILYPIFQGYDSVAIKSDVEIGGNDQLFNLLAGRVVQKKHGQKEQDILTFEMLEGTDGRKMSTSWGNCIYIEDDPSEMYGKVMSITDDLIKRYFVLGTWVSERETKKILKKGPREAKGQLAFEIVKRYHGETKAKKAEKNFEQKFVKNETPEEMPEVKLVYAAQPLADILTDIRLTASKSEARRMIEQGAVKVDGATIGDREAVIDPISGMVIQVGKRKFVRVK